MLRHFLHTRWPQDARTEIPHGGKIPHGVHQPYAHDAPIMTLQQADGEED
ncbi:MAG: hypothetical protein QM811_30285 [Pirellulales bacterium]